MSYTENTENEYLECCKCGQSVDQILSLSCDHNLCLNCAAKTVQKWKHLTVYPPLICQICSSKTQLDPSAVQVLFEMNPQFSCCSDESEQKSEILETKQSQQIISLPTQQTKRMSNITCQQHLTESCVLYCITCDAQCFCMECYLQGLHKNHEVRNITKAFDIVRENGNRLQQQLQGCSEYLLHVQCKIANKKQDLIELIGQAKLQITSSFQELYKTLSLKEQELLQAADELVADKLIEIEGLVAKVKGQTEAVNQYSDQLINYFSLQQIDSSVCVEANNFIVKEKKKIQNLIELVKSEKISPTIESKFCLDQCSLQQMISDTRGVKLQLMSLRGIESTNPTQREKYVYQKAVEDMNRESRVNQLYYEEQKENNNSISFIERSSQRKSFSLKKHEKTGDFYSKFNEAKKQILNQRAQQNY